MGVGDEAGLRLRHADVGKVPARALIDRVVNGADQRVRHVPRVPAQRGAVGFHEGRVLREGRQGHFLRLLQHEARGGGLADAGRPVEDQMLGVGGGELCQKRADGPGLAHDLLQRFRTQKLHDGLGELHLVHLFQRLAAELRLRRFVLRTFFLQDLHADVLHIVLMVFLQLFRDLLLNLVLQRAARHQVGDALRQFRQEFGNLRVRGDMLDGGVFQDDALERQHALPAQGRAHEAHGVHLPRLDDEAVGAQDVRQHAVKRVDLPVQRMLRGRYIAVPFRGVFFMEKIKQLSHSVCISLPSHGPRFLPRPPGEAGLRPRSRRRR